MVLQSQKNKPQSTRKCSVAAGNTYNKSQQSNLQQASGSNSSSGEMHHQQHKQQQQPQQQQQQQQQQQKQSQHYQQSSSVESDSFPFARNESFYLGETLQWNQAQFNAEFNLLVKHLLNESIGAQIKLLQSLRRLLRAYPSAGRSQVLEHNRLIIFNTLWQLLLSNDQSNREGALALAECIMLVVELLGNVDVGIIEHPGCMPRVLPRLVPQLGHESIEVRRACLRLLHAYMRQTSRLNQMINFYIEYGLRSTRKNEQKGCILSLPLLFTQEFVQAQEQLEQMIRTPKESLNLFPLLQCLSELLVHADARLFYPIYLAIQRLHTLLGNNVFRLYLQRVNQEAVMLYEKVLSRSSSNAASVVADASDEQQQQQQLAAEAFLEDSGPGGSNSFGMTDQSNGQFARSATRTEPPEMDKYEKLVLDQLVSAEEDEVRKQSFELLSSPSSILNVEEEFAAAAEKQFPSTLSQSSAPMMTADDTSSGPAAMIYGSQLPSLNLYRPTFESDFAVDQLRRAEMATRQVIKQTGQPIDRLQRIEFENTGRDRRDQIGSKKEELNKSTCPQILESPPETAAEDDTPPRINESQFVQFGLFPTRLIERALSNQLTIKNEALNQILIIVKQAPCTQLSMLASHAHMPSFVQHFLLRLLEHPNFKVTLQALEIIQTLIIRLKHQLLAHLPHLVSVVVKRLGDPRVIVRQQTIQVFQLLTLKLPTQPLLEQLLAHLTNRNARVRSELLNRVIAILLLIPRDQFNLCALCYELSSLLLDPKRAVRLAALECLAVLGHCLGSQRVRKLIDCVAALQRLHSVDGLVLALKARLARRDLPRLLPDGSVRYVLNPSGFAAWYPSLADADIEWILQGSSSASGTPPTHNSMLQTARLIEQSNGQDPNLCTMKRGSCALASTSDLFDQMQLQAGVRDTYNGFRQTMAESAGPPPDTGAKASDCTVEIERLIEKTTTDQLKSRELSTGDSEYSMHSEHFIGRNGPYSYELLQLNHQRMDLDAGAQSQPFDSKMSSRESSSLGPLDNRTGYLSYGRTGPMPSIRRQYESSLEVNKEYENNESTAGTLGTSLRHSRTLSMPAINSSQLSDISEHSEFVSLQPPSSLQAGSRTSSAAVDGIGTSGLAGSAHANGTGGDQQKKDESIQERGQEEYKQNQISKEQNGASGKSAPRTSGDTEGIEINIQRASTISEDSKTATLPDYNQLGSELYIRKRSTISMAKNGEDAHKSKYSEMSQRRPSSNDTKKQSESQKQPIPLPGPSDSEPRSLAEEIQKQADEMRQQQQEQADYEQLAAQYEEFSEEQTLNKSNEQGDSSSAENRRMSRSISPQRMTNSPPIPTMESGIVPPLPHQHHHHHQHQLLRIQPAIPSNANIRNILENVTKTEGPFKEPEEALKAAIAAFTQDAWTTKVEGMLAVNRLAVFHPNVLKKELHTVVLALAYEVKNLRSTVARSSIFTLADLLKKMKGHIDPEMEIIAQALLHKCGENIQFIREDIEKALENFIHHMPPVRAALAIIHHGTNHRNILVRRVGAHYLAELIETMGATKALLGPRDLAESLLPSAAALLLDRDPHARHSARRIFNVLMIHAQFNGLLAKHVQPAVYRTIIGTLQSIRRRGVGERPVENIPTSNK